MTAQLPAAGAALAMLMAATSAAAAPLDAASAQAFMAGLYARYDTPTNAKWAYGSPVDERVFEPVLVKAMRADAALNQNDPGTDWGGVDIFCMCQTYDKVSETTVVQHVGGGHAKAVTIVSLSGAAATTTLHFDLVQVGGEWRVYDVSQARFSLRRDVLAELKKSETRKRF